MQIMSSGRQNPFPDWSPWPHPTDVDRIEHRVSRFDTLAGVAIKYGVEVADIKRMNGLVTDLQMFAHKKLQIPLPGRHPPSTSLSNGSPRNGQDTPPRRRQSDVLESFQSLGLNSSQRRVSPAMSKLQGYYGLAPKMNSIEEGAEVTVVYTSTKTLDLEEGTWRRPLPYSERPLGFHRKSRSYANGFLPDNVDLSEDVVVDPRDQMESDRYQSEKSVRRRQKMEIDTSPQTPGRFIKDENGGAFPGRSSKSLAPRPKSGNRTDSNAARLIAIPFVDAFLANGHSSVQKSSSTSNLQESDSSSLWPTAKCISKVDAISKATFDSLSKPLTSRKNKAALD